MREDDADGPDQVPEESRRGSWSSRFGWITELAEQRLRAGVRQVKRFVIPDMEAVLGEPAYHRAEQGPSVREDGGQTAAARAAGAGTAGREVEPAAIDLRTKVGALVADGLARGGAMGRG